MSSFKFFWTTHKWVGIIGAVIFLNIAVTGFILLFKKQSAWVQPPTAKGTMPGELTVSFDDILAAGMTVPEAALRGWADIDRRDVRPDKGVVKIRAMNRWEVQVDTSTGEVVQTMYRRSDLLETIHDGSFFAQWAHDWLWPVVAIALVFLCFSGFWLWLEPKYRKAKRRKRKAAEAAGGG